MNLKNWLEDIPKEIKIEVQIYFDFLELIHELGYRENKIWEEDELEILSKIKSLAKKSSEKILKTISE